MTEPGVNRAEGVGPNPCRLQSPAAAEALLEQYDRDTRDWTYEKRERFWAAVDIAHESGIVGDGTRIAIIDGSFDTKIEAIADRVAYHSPTEQPGGLTHGTAVALLVVEVAPRSELLLFEVCDPSGIPQYEAICTAVEQAVENGAHVISLSLGRYELATSDPARHGGRSPGLYQGTADELGDSTCELCRVTELAAARGVIVVAAAGNQADLVMCPARSSAVVGCGFHSGMQTARPASDGGQSVQASATVPGQQSQVIDFTLEQPPGVLGTSFATPLLAGFAALFADRSEVLGFLSAELTASAASVMQNLLDDEVIDRSLLPEVAKMYRNALAHLPHRHETSDPPCPECSLFGETTYANYGRFLFFSRDFGTAEALLRVGRSAAPRSPHVAANLAALLIERGRHTDEVTEQLELLKEAGALYTAALENVSDGPAKDMYEAQLERLAVVLDPKEAS